MANKNRYDDLYTGTIAYATLLSCIVLVITILGIRALCCAWVEGEEERKTANAHYLSSDQEIGEQKARLVGYGKSTVEVAGSGEGAAPETVEVIRIPIEEAKSALLNELGTH
ncbi:MAG: hypothetical protein ACE361_24720 [Aureliella sp.]